MNVVWTAVLITFALWLISPLLGPSPIMILVLFAVILWTPSYLASYKTKKGTQFTLHWYDYPGICLIALMAYGMAEHESAIAMLKIIAGIFKQRH